jgi:hypothetical protein
MITIYGKIVSAFKHAMTVSIADNIPFEVIFCSTPEVELKPGAEIVASGIFWIDKEQDGTMALRVTAYYLLVDGQRVL